MTIINKTFKQSFRFFLPIGFIIIISMMAFTSFYTSILTERSAETIIATIKQKNSTHHLIRLMSNDILKRSTIIVEMIQTNDAFDLDELYLEFNEIATHYVISQQKLRAQITNPDLYVLFNKLTPIIVENGTLQSKVYDLLYSGKKVQAIDLFVHNTLPKQKTALDLLAKMETFQFISTREAVTHIEKESKNTHSILVLLNLASILFSVLLALIILKRQNRNDDELSKLARTDILTKLPNRSNLIEMIEQHIKNKSQSNFAIVFLDIDHFKSMNDNYGHEVGDKILQRYTRIIKSSISNNDFIARLGGDEFVLILNGMKTKASVEKFVKKLSSKLDVTMNVDANEIFITSSIGVSLYPEDGTDTKTLLKHADYAMYSAKESGRNGYSFYSEETGEQIEKEHAICHSLQSIFKHQNENGELYLMYQPLLDMNDSAITDCEALIRWKNESGEDLYPTEFIPLAEKSNLIEKINLFVVDEACKQQKQWQEEGIKDIRIHINLSGNKIIFRNILDLFKKNIEKMGLSHHMFGIELTERTLNDISEETIEELDALRKKGIKISIDDFGTDYSSLNTLKKLPITTLKIDKSFIDGLPLDKNDHAMVKTIIDLGHALNLDIVAEGVETDAQFDFLKDNKCNTAQGYLLHRPLDSQQISNLKLVA